MRRRVLLAAGGSLAACVLAGCLGDGSGEGEYDGWMAGVSNFEGTVDRTGTDRTAVEVGVDNGGRPVGFGPPAVEVSVGTTVVWEWVDETTRHDVVSRTEGYEFRSSLQSAGGTFEHAFEAAGTARYVCRPHEGQGMRGVVRVVDD